MRYQTNFGLKTSLYICLALMMSSLTHSGDSHAGPLLHDQSESCCEPVGYSGNETENRDPGLYRVSSRSLQGVAEGSTDFWQALIGGDFDLDNRFRTEIVQMDGLRDAWAFTNRVQLGYGTLPYYGFAAYVDFIDVRPISAVRYNAAGLNNQPDRAVVADPRLSVLNQLYGQFTYDPYDAMLRIGRQRIIHHDARFVGNVGWRQNEQTYDAITANGSFGLEDLMFQYNYVWQINRVLGPDHPLGIFNSRSHLGHAKYDNFIADGTLTGFFYLLDFETAPVWSSQTIGFRTDGGFHLVNDYRINYIGSFARQTDWGNNPFVYSANYFLFDINLEREPWGRLGGAFEVLGSDDGVAAFQTPLATLHAYQGWADVFSTTPDNGLEDLSVYASSTLPWEVEGAIRLHWFYMNEDSGLIGEEFNFSFRKQINDFWSVMLKFADFRGKNGFINRRKFWLQTEIRF